MSERASRASSLSLVSGLGTSSVSGTSESGHVNVEELDDDQLRATVIRLRDHVKSQRMETEIFESYYERLVSGNLSLGNTSSTQSRKTSATQSSNMTPESDSIIQTPSLLDGQRGRLSRKKSSSRTSLASRHKSMKLSVEQRCGIARKELARIELEQKEDRALSKQKITNGNFVLEERSQRIHELLKSMERLDKVLLSGHSFNSMGDDDGEEKSLLNPRTVLSGLLNQQIKTEKRYLDKMKTRNVVTRSRISRISVLIRSRQATLDEIGTVDRTQLYIENNKFIRDLGDVEGDLSRVRGELQDLRLKMDKCNGDHSIVLRQKENVIKNNQKLSDRVCSFKNAIALKKTESGKVLKEVKRLCVEVKRGGRECCLSVDQLALRYLNREKSEAVKSKMLRKKNLEELSAASKKGGGGGRTKGTANGTSSYLYKGLTYDLYFCMPDN